MITARVLAKQGNEWIELDLTEDVRIPVNISIFDLLNVTSKTSNYTKTITFPNTQKNSNFFAQAYNINADRLFDVKKGVDVLIYRSNTLVFEGKMYLLSINESIEKYTYECVCVDTTKSFFDELSQYTLKDLVNSGINITFSKQDIENQSWTNPATAPNYPVYFIMMDKGYAKQNENTNLKNLHPCVFTNWLLEKCCEKVGYQLDSSSIVYNTTDKRFKQFKHLMITGDSSYIDIDQNTIQNNSIQVKNSTNIITNGSATSLGGAVYHQLLANTEILDPSNRWNNATSQINLQIYSFIISVDMRAEIDLIVTYNSTSCAINSPSSINVDVSHYLSVDNSYNIASWLNVSHTFNKVGTSANVVIYRTSFSKILQGIATSQTSPANLNWNILIGDLSILNYSSCYAISILPRLKQKSQTQIYAYPQTIQGNHTVDLKNILPKLNASEFFKAFIKTFNLFYKITSDRKVRLYAFDNYFDTTNIVDISSVVDIQNINQKIISDYFPRSFYYSFTNDDSFFNKSYKEKYKNELYGEYTFDTGFLFKSDKKEYKSPFNYLVPQIDNYVEPTAFSIDGNRKKPIEIKPALLYYNGLSIIIDPRDGLNVTNEETITPNTQYFITGMRRPIGSPFWIDKDTSAYSFYLEYATSPDFDLTYGMPKEIYYNVVGTSITQRNIYYSFFYRWNRHFVDKNSVVIETSVAFASHIPVETNRIYYFDNAYWYLLQIKDWNVNHIELARCVFLKIIDIPDFEFGRIISGWNPRDNILPNTPILRTFSIDRVETQEISTNRITNPTRTANIGINWYERLYDYNAINTGISLDLPSTTIGVQYNVIEGFNRSVTLNLSGNTQTTMNANERGLLAHPRNSTTSTLTITGTDLISGLISVKIVYL